MSKTYNQLCEENRYLYAQLENCTMLMGKATRDGDFKLHMEYHFAKMGVKEMIDRNLDLIEETWNKPVATAKELRERKNLMLFEYKIIETFKHDNKLSHRVIAKRLHTSIAIVENVIIRHLRESSIELTLSA